MSVTILYPGHQSDCAVPVRRILAFDDTCPTELNPHTFLRRVSMSTELKIGYSARIAILDDTSYCRWLENTLYSITNLLPN